MANAIRRAHRGPARGNDRQAHTAQREPVAGNRCRLPTASSCRSSILLDIASGAPPYSEIDAGHRATNSTTAVSRASRGKSCRGRSVFDGPPRGPNEDLPAVNYDIANDGR
jgi:hypothetical protein